MEEKEFLENFTKKLFQTNYIEMLKRGNIAEISDFMNNQKTISGFLYALGASEEMLGMPAHRETLENCLKSIISSTLSAIRDGETDLKVEYLEHGLKSHTESVRYEEKYKLEFIEDMYTFEVARNIGEVSKKVKGSIGKGIIASYAKNHWPVYKSQDSEMFLKKQLDENGFIISEMIETNGENKTIKREEMKIFVDDDQKGIAWNGSPYELNDKSASAREFYTNLCHTILKYPETKSYYESIVGKDIVDNAVKCLKGREDNY